RTRCEPRAPWRKYHRPEHPFRGACRQTARVPQRAPSRRSQHRGPVESSEPGAFRPDESDRGSRQSAALEASSHRGARPRRFRSAFQAITTTPDAALLVLDDPVFLTHRAEIANAALRSRIPAMFGLSGFAAAGGLANYGPHLSDMWRRAARYVDRILKGAKPADLPIEQAARFELVLNLKTAE